jgi:transcriptional regulator with XRE-family HTH domain
VAGKASNELLGALGGAVRAVRISNGMTQEQLAERAGLHTTYVSDVERGRRNIGILNLDRLAQALAIDLPGLVTEVEARRRGGQPAKG